MKATIKAKTKLSIGLVGGNIVLKKGEVKTVEIEKDYLDFLIEQKLIVLAKEKKSEVGTKEEVKDKIEETPEKEKGKGKAGKKGKK